MVTEKIIEHLKSVFPCTCHEAYKLRGLTDPQCMGCSLEPEYEEIRNMARLTEHGSGAVCPSCNNKDSYMYYEHGFNYCPRCARKLEPKPKDQKPVFFSGQCKHGIAMGQPCEECGRRKGKQ